MQTDNLIFAIDQPSRGWLSRVKSPFIAAGWVIPDPGNPLKKVEVKVNGQLRALATTGLRRRDVAGVCPLVLEPASLYVHDKDKSLEEIQ